MTETKTTKNVFNHDDLMNVLSAEVTRMVVAFAKQGYVIDCKFGGYSDGAEARVSMTDGNGWYQIRVEHEYSLFKGEFGCEGYVVRILHFDADYASAKTGTLWAKDGEVVYTEKWYRHGCGYKCVYTNDVDEWRRMDDLATSRYSNHTTTDTREVNYNAKTILDILKKRPGYKRVKAEDIAQVARVNRRLGYIIKLNRKPSKQADTNICIAL